MAQSVSPCPDATPCAVGRAPLPRRSPATLEDIPDDVMTHIIGASLSHADFVCAAVRVFAGHRVRVGTHDDARRSAAASIRTTLAGRMEVA